MEVGGGNIMPLLYLEKTNVQINPILPMENWGTQNSPLTCLESIFFRKKTQTEASAQNQKSCIDQLADREPNPFFRCSGL